MFATARLYIVASSSLVTARASYHGGYHNTLNPRRGAAGADDARYSAVLGW